jgi:CheY-like chemotaxis protein
MRFSSPSTHPNVLLVDDNRDGLLVRRALLEEQGYRVAVAVNGEDALKLFLSGPFDLVVTDYRMPVMGGVELIRRIREGQPHARIVLLSGFVEPLGLTEENTGANAVIAKNSNEAAHLLRWAKRLINRAPARKPPTSHHRMTAASVRARA